MVNSTLTGFDLNLLDPMQNKQRSQTSEKVNEADLCFFREAKMIAETASLELVANGKKMNDMKKDGILVAVEKPSTASTKGSANKAATSVPSNSKSTAFIVVLRGSSIPFSSSSPPSSPKR